MGLKSSTLAERGGVTHPCRAGQELVASRHLAGEDRDSFDRTREAMRDCTGK